MQGRTEELALKKFNLRLTVICDTSSKEMKLKFKNWKGMSDNRVKNLVKNVCTRANDVKIIRSI